MRTFDSRRRSSLSSWIMGSYDDSSEVLIVRGSWGVIFLGFWGLLGNDVGDYLCFAGICFQNCGRVLWNVCCSK